MKLWLLNAELLNTLSFRNVNGEYLVKSTIKGLWRKAGPEEILRQLFIQKLILHYRTPPNRIVEEYPVQMGIAKKRVDVAVLTPEGEPLILCELKQELNDSSMEQLKSYMVALGAGYGVLASAVAYKCVSLSGRNCIVIKDIPQLGEFVRTAFNQIGIKKSPPEGGSLLTDSYLNSVSPLPKDRFLIVMHGQRMQFTENQLFNFQAVRRAALKRGIRIPSNFSAEDWGRYVAQKLKENHIKSEAKVAPDVSYPEDRVEDFLKKCTTRANDTEVTKHELFVAYKEYCLAMNFLACGKIQFGRRVRELGYNERRANDGIHVWRGVSLVQSEVENPPNVAPHS